MPRRELNIAVTGLNATDNPGPGVSVIRSLLLADQHRGEIIGLAYDTLDPGLYARELGLWGSFLIPYPSQGLEALRDRLLYIHGQIRLDVIIPTLDSELPAMIALAPELARHGIHVYLPSREQFELRSKVRLAELGRRAGITVPATRVISDVAALYRMDEEISYPFMVKGVFYGAQMARSLDEAVAAYHHTVARWGLPVIIQKFLPGEEYDVVAVGDGRGGLAGAVPMKKLYLTDKGKAWAGVAVRDPALIELTRRFVASTGWRGPCETEILRAPDGEYALIEVNPRFPAWTFLAAGAGQNLPWLVARLAMGERVPPMTDFRAGTMFVRIAIDQLARMEDFQAIASAGELLRDRDPIPAAPAPQAAPKSPMPRLATVGGRS